MNVVKYESGKNYDFRRLKEFFAGTVDKSYPCCTGAIRRELDSQYLGLRLELDVGFQEQIGQDCRLRAGLGIVAASELLAKSTVRACAQLRAQRIYVRLREIASG